MSPWRREPVGLGLGADRVVLWHGARTTSVPLVLAPDAGDDRRAAALADALRALRAQAPWGRARPALVVDHHWLRWWTQAVPDGARSLSELRAVTESRCTQLFGGAPGRWRIAGDWRSADDFLCVATPGWIVDAAREAGAGPVDTLLGCQLRHAGDAARAPLACLVCADAAVVLSLRAGQVRAARPLRLAAEVHERERQIVEELRRAALRDGVALTDAALPCFDTAATGPQRIAVADLILERRPYDGLAALAADRALDPAAFAAILASGTSAAGAQDAH